MAWPEHSLSLLSFWRWRQQVRSDLFGMTSKTVRSGSPGYIRQLLFGITYFSMFNSLAVILHNAAFVRWHSPMHENVSYCMTHEHWACLHNLLLYDLRSEHDDVWTFRELFVYIRLVRYEPDIIAMIAVLNVEPALPSICQTMEQHNCVWKTKPQHSINGDKIQCRHIDLICMSSAVAYFLRIDFGIGRIKSTPSHSIEVSCICI